MDLLTELESLLRALESGRVRYALAGGLALAVHGVVRATVDVDLLLPEEEIERVSGIAAALGYRAPTELAFTGGLRIRRLVKFEGEDFLVLDLLRVDASSVATFSTAASARAWAISRSPSFRGPRTSSDEAGSRAGPGPRRRASPRGFRGMSRVDSSPAAVKERVRLALVQPASGGPAAAAKGVRMDPEAVRARLRQVAQLRRLGRLLRRPGSSTPAT